MQNQPRYGACFGGLKIEDVIIQIAYQMETKTPAAWLVFLWRTLARDVRTLAFEFL